MNVKPVVKVVSCLTGLFLLGSVCGFAMSGRVAAARQPAAAPLGGGGQWVERWLDRRMVADFALIQATPGQQEALRPAYQDLRADFAAIQQEAAGKVAESIKRHRLAVWAQLTPEQRQAFRQSNQERRLRFFENRSGSPSK
jgi:hypothetical protein